MTAGPSLVHNAPRIRVLCVEDHLIVRDGITLIINREPDMAVVASAASGEDAVALFDAHAPDITLMDLQLPVMSGVAAIKAIRQKQPDARVIVLTMYQGDEDIFRAIEAGAVTYLLKDTLSDDLIDTVRRVHGGGRPMPPEIQARLDQRSAASALTAREIQVLELVAAGNRNKEIASRLAIAEETVHGHLRNVFAKLNVNDRTAAVHIALRRGFLHIQ